MLSFDQFKGISQQLNIMAKQRKQPSGTLLWFYPRKPMWEFMSFQGPGPRRLLSRATFTFSQVGRVPRETHQGRCKYGTTDKVTSSHTWAPTLLEATVPGSLTEQGRDVLSSTFGILGHQECSIFLRRRRVKIDLRSQGEGILWVSPVAKARFGSTEGTRASS